MYARYIRKKLFSLTGLSYAIYLCAAVSAFLNPIYSFVITIIGLMFQIYSDFRQRSWSDFLLSQNDINTLATYFQGSGASVRYWYPSSVAEVQPIADSLEKAFKAANVRYQRVTGMTVYKRGLALRHWPDKDPSLVVNALQAVGLSLTSIEASKDYPEDPYDFVVEFGNEP